jgi:hypothetical protein
MSGVTIEFLRRRFSYNHMSGVVSYAENVGRADKKRFVGDEAGRITQEGYREIKINGRHYRCHRIAWAIYYGEWPKNQIDHINGVRLDNSIANLRDVTQDINMQNQIRAHKRNSSGSSVVGVTKNKHTNKFIVSGYVGGSPVYVGGFDDLDSAEHASIEFRAKNYPGFTFSKTKGGK